VPLEPSNVESKQRPYPRSSKGAAAMRRAVIAGLVALVAIILAVFMIAPSLLPSGHNRADDGMGSTPDAVVPRPMNLSPSADAVIYGPNLTLEWTADPDADSYVVIITVPGSSIAAVNLTSATNSYDLDGMLSGGDYLWAVQAVEDGVYGQFSNETQFTIKTSLDAPVLQSPAGGSVHVNSVPTLRWSSVSDATGYRLQVSTDAEFNHLLVDSRLNGTTYVPAFVMEDGTVYSWRVSAYHCDAWSNWSLTRQFSHSYFLAAPLPLAPVSGSTVDGGQLNLTWSSVEGATSYRVQVSASASFGTLLVNAQVSGQRYLVTAELAPGTTYHWRVQAVNKATTSSWCAVSDFLVPADRMSFSYEWTYNGRTWWLNGSAPGSEYYALHDLARNYDYASYVMDADPTVISVASELKSMAAASGHGGDIAQFVLAFVQGVPYTSDLNTTGQVEYPRYPVETLVDGGGDCEDKAALYASLMQSSEFNVDAVMIMYTSTTGDSGHMAVGIAGSYSGSYYVYEGKDFYYCETTGEGWMVGEFPRQLNGFDATVLPC